MMQPFGKFVVVVVVDGFVVDVVLVVTVVRLFVLNLVYGHRLRATGSSSSSSPLQNENNRRIYTASYEQKPQWRGRTRRSESCCNTCLWINVSQAAVRKLFSDVGLRLSRLERLELFFRRRYLGSSRYCHLKQNKKTDNEEKKQKNEVREPTCEKG